MTQLDAIHKGQLLEDEFFHLLDQDLRAKLRESMEREEAKRQLTALVYRGFQFGGTCLGPQEEAAMRLMTFVKSAAVDAKVLPPMTAEQIFNSGRSEDELVIYKVDKAARI